jgi:hypothetical protein
MKLESDLKKWLNNQLSIVCGMEVTNVDLKLIKILMKHLQYDNSEELIYNQIRRQMRMNNEDCKNLVKGFINYYKSLIRNQKLKYLFEYNFFCIN